MASPQAEMVKGLLTQIQQEILGRAEPPTLEEMRASGEAFGEMTAEPNGVTWHDEEVAGVPCRWAVPEGGADDRVLQYVHGGGYVLGSLDGYQKFTGHLANSIGCRVLSVDYRLAPEHPHPAAVEDSSAVYRALLNDFDPAHMAISGDSAGGGLTVATVVKLRDDGSPQPAGAVPLSPWVDLEGTGESMQTKADLDLIVGSDGLKQMADMFVAGQDLHDPLAAPLHADLAGICPLYVQVGGDETLLDDATRLAAKAAASGVEVRLDAFPEMQHVFQMAAGNVPESDDAVARIGQWLRPKLGL